MALADFAARAKSFLTEPTFANVEGMTPQDVERRRQLAARMLGESQSDQPVVSFMDGLSRLVNAGLGNWGMRAAENADQQQQTARAGIFGDLGNMVFGAGATGPNAPPPGLAAPSFGGTGNAGTINRAGQPNAPAVAGFDPSFETSLNALLDAGRAAGFPDLEILSGYRSPERQGELYNQKLAEVRAAHPDWSPAQVETETRRWVAPAGHSYHNQGLAADIGYGGAGLGSAPPEVIQWLHDNAGQYGLQFPLSNENWHIEPIGARDGHTGAAAPSGGAGMGAAVDLLLSNPQTAPLAEQLILAEIDRQMTAAGAGPDYDFMNVDGTVVRTDAAAGTAEPVWRGPTAPDAPDFGDVNTLRTQFNALTSDFRQVDAAYRRVDAAGADPSAAGDLALIFNYMKMLDPGSTVREGEFATAQNSTSIPGQIMSLYNQIVSGERLNAQQRADFLDRAIRLYGAARGQYNVVAEQYTNLSNQLGVDPTQVVLPWPEYTPRAGSGAAFNPARAEPTPANPLGFGPPAPQTEPVHVNTPAEAEALPPGTLYVTPDGQQYRR